jgi:hypothetical protein
MIRDRRPVGPAEAWTALALALDSPPPPAHLRDRVMAAAGRAAPYRSFVPHLAECFDLTERAVHELLARMHDPGNWTPGGGAMLAFLHFDAGPRLAVSGKPAHCGVSRMRSGTVIPGHVHRGREVTFVLRGQVTDGEGRHVGAGQVLDMPTGSAHSLRIEGDPDALLAVLLAEIEIVPRP